MKLQFLWSLLHDALVAWNNDNAMQLAAMLAFYMVFSFAPILILLVAAASSVFGRETVRAEVVNHLQGVFSKSGATMVQTVLQNAQQTSTTATLIGIIAVIFGATMVFVALQDALNAIWGVTLKSGNVIKQFFRKRLISFVMILIVGVALLISTSLSAALMLAGDYVNNLGLSTRILGLIQFWISTMLAAILFGIVYKILPDVIIAWSDVWIGAIVTSLLFNLGRMLMSLYLSRSILGSLYGAAGSFAVFLIWIYYSAQVFFFGAEFTQVYAKRRGFPILPDENSVAFKTERHPHHK